MRLLRFVALPFLVASLACEGAPVEGEDTVQLTLRLNLLQGIDVGTTPGRVYVYSNSEAVPRAFAFPEDGEECVLSVTPVTTCTFEVPRFSYISMIAAEPDPAIIVRFAPEAVDVTVRDGRYVEFTRWTECDDRTERGLCVMRASGDFTIEANFQLLQQVLVYQTGAARMDYVMISAAPTLKVPAENDNVLDLAGCRRLLNVGSPPCDSVRALGDAPRYHRLTAFVPRQTIVGMFSNAGRATELQQWDGPCVQSGLYGLNTCSLITPDTAGPPIRITVRYSWWDCPTGPSDVDLGNCTLREIPRPRLKGAG